MNSSQERKLIALRLEDIKSPKNIKGLSYPELEDLAAQIRKELVTTISKRGGHLASNLGVVELTMALHRVFDMPSDKLVFDVGHQSYVHKLLTGRYAMFHTLRTYGGLAGFPKRSESEYDVFETGHASTAISAALGLARARDYRGENYSVIALVGDGALTGGMCYEALNDAGDSKTPLIVILNDNEMSISPNVGALSQHLTDIRVSKGWTSTKKAVHRGLDRIPYVGRVVARTLSWAKDTIKSAFAIQNNEGFFDSLGFRYFGPIDGHDLRALEHTFQSVKALKEPVVVHVLTKKGYGYDKAEEHPDVFHGTPPFCIETGDATSSSSLPSYGKVMADTLIDMAKDDDRIVTISAAMPISTGVSAFGEKYPGRMLDVGIAEEHATTLAAGLAAGGMKPYFAVYASFFQRGFDQMIHDICMPCLPVTILLDRAGLVGEDGATHHGVWDLASLLPVPNVTILAPRDIHDLRRMIRWTGGQDKPCAIRYGRSSVDMSARYPCPAGDYVPGKWEMLESGTGVTLLAVGSMVTSAVEVRDALIQAGVSVMLVSCGSVKPMDEALLRKSSGSLVVTMEEHVLSCGFGSEVSRFYAEEGLPVRHLAFGIPDTFVQHGRHGLLLRHLGLDAETMTARILSALKEKSNE